MFTWWLKFLGLSVYAKLKWLLFVVILIVAAYRRFELPLTPFADHDLRGYLKPVVDFYRFHYFGHANCRSFSYPMFVLVTSWLDDSLHGVTIAQHLLGLLTGILIFNVWEQPFIKGFTSFKIKFVATSLQLISAGYFLLATGIILFEHTIRPESLAIFLIVLLLFLLIKNISRPVGSSTLLSASFFIAFLLALLFPRSLFAMVLAGFYVVYSILRLPVSQKQKAMAIGLPFFLVAAFLFLPEQYLIKKYDPDTNSFAQRQFFYSHADIAQPLIAKDFTHQRWASDTELHQIARALVIHPPTDTHFKQLGYNPDELMYGPVAATIDSILDTRANAFYGFYDRKIFVLGFQKYATRVLHELVAYYGYNTGFQRIYMYEQPIYYKMFAETKNSLLPAMEEANHMFISYVYEAYSQANYTTYNPFTPINLLYFLLQLTFLPVLALFVVAFTTRRFIATHMNTQQLNHFAKLGLACGLLFAMHFALVLTVATIHSFGIERYGTSIFPVAILLQCFCLLYLTVAGVHLLKRFN